jgi:hypothetical protein
VGRVEDFLSANREVLRVIEESVKRSGGKELTRAVKIYERVYGVLWWIFRASASLAGEISSVKPAVTNTLKLARLGLHVAMFQDKSFIDKLIDEVDKTDEEEVYSELLGIPVDDLRLCLEASYVTAMRGGHWSPVEIATTPAPGRIPIYRPQYCTPYWKRGFMLPHLGSLVAAISENPFEGVPRRGVINALVPWLLGVVRDIASGSPGAGSIGIVGASIGMGKTTTLYYTLRAVLSTLGVSDPDSSASKLILLDPADFLDLVQVLSEREEKVPIVVVDNASAVFPKHWHRIGGEMHKFFLHMNTVIDMLRAVSGATVFVANAPDELASFIRNAATINIGGDEDDIKTYKVTLFTWKKRHIQVRREGEFLRKVERIASVYVYPLLKLPQEVYKRDLEVKRQVSKRELVKAIESAKRALEERGGKKRVKKSGAQG